MRKIIFSFMFLLIAGVIFAQEYTFQGLPWGSTKEQVIAKLGEPSGKRNNDKNFYYLVSLNGYKAQLIMGFYDNKSLDSSVYNINALKDLTADQVNIAFHLIFLQLVEKYGAYTELISEYDDTPISWVWHFNNFHIIIYNISFNQFGITYCSTLTWNRLEESFFKTKKRLPNRGL